MNNITKAKEPWLGVLLNLIFPGLGELYAKRKIRAFIIMGIAIILLGIIICDYYILFNFDINFTKALIIGGIIFGVFGILFGIFVLINGFLSVKKFNISNNVDPTNKFVKILAIIGCVFLFFSGGTGGLIGNYVKSNINGLPLEMGGKGMKPTLKGGDKIFVKKGAFDNTKPQRWDVIAFEKPQDKKRLISRIIGLPGETLQIKEGNLIINGEKIKSKFYYYNNIGNSKNIGNIKFGKEGQKIEIPQNSYFVLSDNSHLARDSRFFGFISKEDIIGKVKKIYWPLDRCRVVK